MVHTKGVGLVVEAEGLLTALLIPFLGKVVLRFIVKSLKPVALDGSQELQ